MAFILDIPEEAENPVQFKVLARCMEVYEEYLRALGDRLPASLRQFILAPWYRDYEAHQCSYDAWLESAQFTEPATGPNQQIRRLRFEIRLLGPYHDGHIIYLYENVQNYRLTLPGVDESIYAAHDGWRLDEIRMTPDNKVIHEIAFKSGARWLIESDSISHSWIPLNEG
jgi:hypothetical protein